MANGKTRIEEQEATSDTVAFPVLTPQEITVLRRYGDEVELEHNEPLWSAGERDYCFFVILSGGCCIRDAVDSESLIVFHGPGNFSGDVDIMTGRPAPIGGFADGPTRALRLSAENIREVVRVEQDLGGKLLLAFIRRRERLLNSAEHGALLIGSRFDPETQNIREFLGRNRVVHRWKQPEDEAIVDVMRAFDFTAKDTPLFFLGTERLVHPTIEELADKLGVRRATSTAQYDLVIVGAGPAGLAAAVYGASEGLRTLLADRSAPGGQASWSSRIENYMGFPEGLTGSDLAARGLIQAQKFGAEITVPAEVTHIECDKSGHCLRLSSGDLILARAVIVASGARYQKLSVPGFKKFEGSGIFYAATRLESSFCHEQEVVVIGAGNSAGQAAVFLSQHCKTVRLIVRGDRLNKSMSDYLSYRVEQIRNIEVHLGTEVAECKGDRRLNEVCLRGNSNGSVPCAGLFVFIGATPNTEFLTDSVALDENGFVLTGESIGSDWRESRSPFYLESSCPGIFAAGDCRQGSVKRVASSVGEGSMAVTFVHRFLEI